MEMFEKSFIRLLWINFQTPNNVVKGALLMMMIMALQ